MLYHVRSDLNLTFGELKESIAIFLDPRIVCDPRVFWYPRALSNVPKASKVATFSTLYYEDVTFQLNLNYLSTFILLAHSDKRSLCHDALLIFFEHVSMKLFASFTTEIGSFGVIFF